MKTIFKLTAITVILFAMVNCKTSKSSSGTITNEEIAENRIGSIGKVHFVYQGQNITHTTVRAADGNVWLQQNLGAKNVASSISDNSSYGDLYVWGRWSDGHEKRSNPDVKYNATANPNNPQALNKEGNNPFYSFPKASGYWWFQGTDQDLWSNSTPQRVDEYNGCDPCKQLLGGNWRLPSRDEWQRVIDKENITNYKTAFESNLKMPLAGYRLGADAKIHNEGKLARFWSNTSSNKGSAYLVNIANNKVEIPAYSRSGGLSIRCIRK